MSLLLSLSISVFQDPATHAQRWSQLLVTVEQALLLFHVVMRELHDLPDVTNDVSEYARKSKYLSSVIL